MTGEVNPFLEFAARERRRRAPVAAAVSERPDNLQGRAAASTIEALMFELRERRGATLKKSARRRLSQLSEPQLHEICGRLQKLAWSNGEVKQVIETWTAHHVG